MADAKSGSRSLDARLARYRSRPGGAEDAEALARALLEEGRGAEAHEVAGSALREDPEHAELLILDGRARFATGDLLGAQAALLRAARVSPRRLEPFLFLGEVLLRRGDPLRALKVLERAEAIDRTDPGVRQLVERARRLGNVAESAGRGDEAASAPPRPPAPRGRTGPGPSGPGAAVAPPWAAPGGAYDDEDDDDEETIIRTDGAALRQQVRDPVPPPPRRTQALGTRGPVAPPPPSRPGEPPPSRPLGPPPPEDRPGHRAAPDDPTRPPGRLLRTASGDPFAGPSARGPVPEAAPPSTPDAPPSPGASPAGLPSARELLAEERDDGRVRLGPFDAPDGPPGPTGGVVPPADPVPTEPEAPVPSGLEFLQHPAIFDDQTRGRAPAEAADVPVGGGEGAEDVDGVLSMLEKQGLFEDPAVGGGSRWATRREARSARTHLGLVLGLVWLVVIGLAAGGYFGYQAYLAERRQRAAALVEEATARAYAGDHADLVAAERQLREARDLHFHDRSGPTLLLLVQGQRALEGGAFEAGYLRPAIARGEEVDADGAYLEMARAILGVAEGHPEAASAGIAAALEARPRDASILYLAGRLGQRLGQDEALERLTRAAELEPRLAAPAIALAEARYDEGRADEAMERLGAVLERYPDHLRGRLWRAYLEADEGEPGGLLTALTALEQTVEDHGAPTDRVLYELTRAHLLRRRGDAEGSGEAVDAALDAGASEPRLLALVANEGRRAGRLGRAHAAAAAAVQGAPANQDFRKLLAEIEVARRDGEGAIRTLASLPGDDPSVVLMRGEAALLVGARPVVETASGEVDAFLEAQEAPSVELRALRIRLGVALGEASSLLAEARRLAREAPGDADAARALGEAALRTQDARTANGALEEAVAAAPERADLHYLLGRARRLAGQPEEAEGSLRRALELSPSHLEAKLALGNLLVDTGRYEAADAVFEPLAGVGRVAGGRSVGVVARLGRAEALIGQGKVEDAAVQLEALPQRLAETPTVRLVRARLALAEGRAAEALRLLRPLATAEEPDPLIVAVYADALMLARQLDAALEAYDRALSLDSTLPEALLGAATIAVEDEDWSYAGDLLTRLNASLARRIRPPSFAARRLLLLGRGQLATGNASAGETLERAVASSGAPPEAYFFLGEARAAASDPDGAREAYARYLELDPEGPHAERAARAVGR
ncbi:MAG: tetratricopeptide repeat protein [Sandaracinaceae bacterium]